MTFCNVSTVFQNFTGLFKKLILFQSNAELKEKYEQMKKKCTATQKRLNEAEVLVILNIRNF